MKPATSFDTHLARLFLAGLAGIGVVCILFSIPAESIGGVPCLAHRVTGIPCPGCGMTRACLNLAKGNWATAWHYHPLSFALVGLSIAMAFFPIQLRAAWRSTSVSARRAILALTLLVILGLWVVRLNTL